MRFFVHLGWQVNNKLQIVQSLLVHDVLLKHKAALDQTRKGLSILGLLAEIGKFQPLCL